MIHNSKLIEIDKNRKFDLYATHSNQHEKLTRPAA